MSIQRWAVLVLSLAVALVSYRFLALGLDLAFADIPGHLSERRAWFTLHVSAAPVALALGAVQFFPRLRARHRWLHVLFGRAYFAAILVAGLAGLMLSIGAAERPVAALGFGLLSVLWIGFTARAVLAAIKGQTQVHRRWMIRSFALTFAAVTLRLLIPVLLGLGYESYAAMSTLLAWLCWVPNLAVAEWALRRA